MSRYVIPLWHKNLEAVVGWDQGLQTYFGQIFDDTKEIDAEQCLLWVGTTPYAIPTVHQLEAAMHYHYHAGEDYVVIPSQTRIQLLRDKKTQPPLTALQHTVLRFLADLDEKEPQ